MLVFTLLVGVLVFAVAPLALLWRLAVAMQRRRTAGGAIGDLTAEITALRDQTGALRRELTLLESDDASREVRDA